MLFKRLYNWIKNKSLPTSFLFKNRLFIERDSKHRRIYNMFGSIFRNTKWTSYELSNLKQELKNHLTFFSLRALVWVVVFFIFVGYKHLNYDNFVGFACHIGWLCVEAYKYTTTFVVWLWLFIYYTLINWIYSFFFTYLFKTKSNFKMRKPRTFFQLYNEKYKQTPNKTLVADFDFSSFYQNWLILLQNREKLKQLENSFSTTFNKKIWTINKLLIPNLFLTTFSHDNIYSPAALSKTFIALDFESAHTRCLHENNHKLKTKINKTPDLTPSPSIIPTNEALITSWDLKRNLWNFTQLNIEKEQAPSTKNFVDSNFYLYSLTFSSISQLSSSQAFVDMQTYARNQINAAKWNRWLYRYSVLHRRLLKNSHKLTITKRLLQSGFYDDKLSSRNTWVNHRSFKIKKKTISHLGALYYSGFFSESSPTTVLSFTPTTNPDKNSLLSFYENSFFWFSKRFYLFNTTPSNMIRSTPQTNEIDKQPSQSLEFLIAYFYLLNKSTCSFYLNLSEFDLSDLKWKLPTQPISLYCRSYDLKDFSLFFEDADLFSSEIMDIVSFVAVNASTSNQNPTYFPVLFNLQSSPLMSNLFFTQGSPKSIPNVVLLNKMSFVNLTFIKDLAYVNFLINN